MEESPRQADAPAGRFSLRRWWMEHVRPRRGTDTPGAHSSPAEETDSGQIEAEAAQWVELLGQPEDPGHKKALGILTAIGRPAVPALIAALESENWVQVFRACEALGLIRDRHAVRPLTRALYHSNSNVRWGAAEALGRMRSRRPRGRLHRIAQEDDTRTSWGEPVAEAAERALESIDQTLLSRLISALEILGLLALCAAILFGTIRFVRAQIASRPQRTPTATPTTTPTLAPSPLPTATPLPEFPPIRGVITNQIANVRDLPDATAGTIIGALHQDDEIWIHGGRLGEDGVWWYMVTLAKINNPETMATSDLLQQGAYGWIYSSLVAGAENLQVKPTVAAIETMRAAEATPTPLGTPIPLPTATSTVTPTATLSP